ncbi:haloacid dehalogenase-like hydrolase [Vibrio sp. Of7-15]|uniref:HAD hydrolase-like protein n=1 Tax=Vibrio sp. Of7-15 TaxID=2724879 RepID=UPI001EF184F6|nr:HAD family hydrolase [Vibrio sp. Of7-15]MCG7495658.1 haloacid dehalogenase-like hydrolase [Vibrio sp. Of7-15]
MVHLVMFDIDGTLIKSCVFDADCFCEAVRDVTGYELNTDWESYNNITDTGILDEFISQKGLEDQREHLQRSVKEKFIQLVESHLTSSPAREIEGSINFLKYLQSREDVEIAIATGGWEQTAKAKLKSAGFDISGIAFASSTDHCQRVGVMQVAEARCQYQDFVSKTYFGDGVWDKKACEDLAYNFVLVGNKLTHSQQIDHFKNTQQALIHIGIE